MLAIELINLVALLMSQQAVALGIPSLVAAVETTIPAYTFILSIVLHRLNLPLNDARVFYQLRLKWLLLGIMMVGIFGVS